MLQAMLYQTMPLNLNVQPPSTPDATSCGGNTTDGSDHDVAVAVETPDPPKRKRRRQQRATYHIRKVRFSRQPRNRLMTTLLVPRVTR